MDHGKALVWNVSSQKGQANENYLNKKAKNENKAMDATFEDARNQAEEDA